MKKFLLSISIIFISILSTSAQLTVNFGAKGGVNLATLLGDNAEGLDMLTGAAFGGIVRLSNSGEEGFVTYAIQGELLYSMQGAKSDGGKFSLSYLNIPIMVQRYIANSGFYLETGPQIGILLSAKYKEGDLSEDLKNDSKKIDFTMNVGLGYLFNNGLGINTRAGFGVTSIPKEGSMRNAVIHIGLFYVFGQNTDY